VATTEKTAALTETEERNLRAVTDVLEFWNVRDVDGVLTFYDDDITWKNVAMEETYEGKAGVGAFLTRFFSAIPDLHFSVPYKIARGDNVAEQWLIEGTHDGSLFGVPATGRKVTLPGMSMVTLRDGKFLRDEFYFDSGIFLRQIGLMPAADAIDKVVPRAFLTGVVKTQRGWRKLRRR
jgi:steroid delta-isomerase-like uncharacterized protein